MNRWRSYSALVATRAVQAGFTMIELLVVIAILGILAVAVLSAINPIEQINRGRDTGLRSDAEQLISAIERYNAFNGWYPWVSGANDDATLGITHASDTAVAAFGFATSPWVPTSGGVVVPGCNVLDRLGAGPAVATANCVGTDELKITFNNRISDTNYRGLFVYKEDNTTATNPYVCFFPQSRAFLNEANTRCGLPLPGDFPPFACAADPGYIQFPNGEVDGDWICLP